MSAADEAAGCHAQDGGRGNSPSCPPGLATGYAVCNSVEPWAQGSAQPQASVRPAEAGKSEAGFLKKTLRYQLQ